MLRLRRPLLRAAIVLIFLAALAPRGWHLWTLVGADDWGSDWLWLADGLDRLVAGLPLNHPEYVAAPFSQLPNGPAYTWSLHPPYNATLFSPSLLLPVALRQAAWTWLMAAVVVAAAWLAWPRRLWWGTHLLVAAAVLASPVVGLVDQVHFANPNALVVLGVVLVWHGRRRDSLGLVIAGLVLAAVKITPAVALAAWLLAARNGAATGRRSVLLAALGAVALTIPVLLLDPGVIGDTIRVQLNLVPWDGVSNLAPQVLLAPILGADAAALLSRAVGLGLVGLILVRRLDGPGGFLIAASAPLLLTPQLWLHWFLIPAAAALLAAGAWPRFRDLDARLRTLGTVRPPAPAAARTRSAAGGPRMPPAAGLRGATLDPEWSSAQRTMAVSATIDPASPVADAVFVGGRVHTVDAADRVTDALAVRDGRVLTTGETAAIRRHVGRDTLVVDLAGRSLVPGFIDNHIHMSNATQRAWIDVSYPACRSIGQIVDAVAARAAAARPGTWVLARGFDPARLREGREPTRLDLDGAIPDHPVGIANREGMGWTFNTAGLRRIGVTDTTPDPPGGPLARDAQGSPLGPMWDNARTVFVNPNLPAPDLAAQADACAHLARDLNAAGVTAAYEASYRRAIDSAAWRRVQAEAPPTLRVALGPYPLHGDHWDERGIAGTVAASGLSTGFGNEWLRLGSLQLGIDGGILGRTAALLAPYADDPVGARRGSFRVTEETLAAAIRRAFDADWQVGLICQGDAGIERALAALASVLAVEPGRDRRPRLEHAYLWNPVLMDRAAELRVTWNTQPGILPVAGPAATIGAWGDRARWAFPFRSLLERGVPISSGSDWGVGPLDPIAALDALVTHRFGPGDGDAALNPDETITIAQALRVMTLGSARAGFLEDELGSLEPGKRADLAILSADLASLSPAGVRSLRVDETWLGGRPVWRREPAEGRPA